MHERVSWLYKTCQCGLCKSPHEECGPTHQLLPVHIYILHRSLGVELYRELCTFLRCKLCKYKLFCEVISVSLHMSVITQNGDSALMMAASEGRTEDVPLLLEAGANINLQNVVCLDQVLSKTIPAIDVVSMLHSLEALLLLICIH